MLRYEPSLKELFRVVRTLRRNCGSLESSLRESLAPELALARRIRVDAGAEDSESPEGASQNDRNPLSASFKRAQEAARILEEYLKSLNLKKGSETYRQVRFALYEIEELAVARLHRDRLSAEKRARLLKALEKLPVLLVISEENTRNVSPIELARTFHESGGRILQIRLKNGSARQMFLLVKSIKKELPDALVIVNDRADVAVTAEADGVHLGEDDLPVSELRGFGERLIIGKTVREAKSAKQAVADGADYLGAGSVFKSPTKPKAKVIGIVGLKSIRRAVNVPVVAIGGINEENFSEVIEAGANGVAVISVVSEGISAKRFYTRVRKFRKER